MESKDGEEASGAAVDPVVLPDHRVAGRESKETSPRSGLSSHLAMCSRFGWEAVSLRKISSRVSLPEHAYAFLISPSVSVAYQAAVMEDRDAIGEKAPRSP